MSSGNTINVFFCIWTVISSFQSDLCMSQGLGVDGFHQFYNLLWASIMSFKVRITLLEGGEERKG